MESRKLPIRIQSFEDLRKNDCMYVDKTEYIWKLTNTGKSYFLSRPDGFGKSLLISTIEAYFRGEKELFKGLAIEKHENAKGKDGWQKYPVIRFDLENEDLINEAALRKKLGATLSKYAVEYDVPDDPDITLSTRFCSLLCNIYQKYGKQIVVLIDENYNPSKLKPEMPQEMMERIRMDYSDFLCAVKDADAYIEFFLIAGVTKYYLESPLISGPNQEDISLHKDYAAICGFTEEELKTYFQPEILKMSDYENISETECLEQLSENHGGYHFSEEKEGVYNPFSVLHALKYMKTDPYWFQTETTSYALEKVRESEELIQSFSEDRWVDIYQILNNTAEYMIPSLYQAGYLTIKNYDREYHAYKLGFPNKEVRDGLLNALNS